MTGRAPDVLVEQDVAVPCRDGVVLRADVYRPADGHPVPAIVLRTPYDKSSRRRGMNHSIDPVRAVNAGFACVLQDVRGRFASAGEFVPYVHEELDGYDTVQWAAGRPWCTGRVGMTGASYSGLTQLLAAIARPPALRAIVPMLTGSRLDEGWTYQGGATQLGFLLTWSLGNLAPDLTRRAIDAGAVDADAAERQLDDVDELPSAFLRGIDAEQRPLKEIGVGFLDTWLAHPPGDAFWRAVSVADRWDDIVVPGLHVGGWFDPFLAGTIANFRALQERRGDQRLLVGPWTHGSLADHVPGTGFGVRADRDAVDVDGAQLRHFAEHLLDEPNDDPVARVFVLGAGRWCDSPVWPRPSSAVTLRLGVEGTLDSAVARPGELTLHHDPADPCPTLGGPTFLPGPDIAANAGPRDHAVLLRRDDVLLFTTAVLETPLAVCGEVSAALRVRCSVAVADVVVRLLDHDSDGRAMLLAEGITRVRSTPGQAVDITVSVGWTDLVLPAGHAVAVTVSGASFPRFDLPGDTPVDVTVMCDVGSALTLPVVDD